MERPDRDLVHALRNGQESAFVELVDRYGASLLRLAQTFVRSRAVAEEVVQETWVGVLRGIDRFEERSSLKTWIYRILTNTAKTRAQREGRSLPFSALESGGEPADPDRFVDGSWVDPPRSWSEVPEGRLVSKETREVIAGAIEELPPGQRAVISLRDLEGWDAEETCNALDLSETNQRVLLHRARAKVRRALERYLDEDAA